MNIPDARGHEGAEVSKIRLCKKQRAIFKNDFARTLSHLNRTIFSKNIEFQT